MEKQQLVHTFPTKEQLIKNKNPFTPMTLISNHFGVKTTSHIFITEWHMKMYTKDQKSKDSIELNPDSRIKIREIVGVNRADMKKSLGYVFFSGVQLYSTQNKIKENSMIFDKHNDYYLELQKKNEDISLEKLIANEEMRKLPLQYLNSLIKHIFFEKKFQEIGKNRRFYDVQKTVQLNKAGIELFKGYLCTFEIYEAGLKLLVDMSNKIIQIENLWQEFLKQDIKQNDKNSIENFFIDKGVITNYGDNFKRYVITGVDFDKNPATKFPSKDYKNFIDYYQKQYKQTIKCKDQFLLTADILVNDKEKGRIKQQINLVPELVRSSGLLEYQCKDRGLMQELGTYTIVNPKERMEIIQNLLTETFNSQKKNQPSFLVEMKTNKVQGYKMNQPQLVLKNKTISLKTDRIKIQELSQKKDLTDWLIIYDFKNKQNLKVIEDALYKAAKTYNITVDEPAKIILPKENYYSSRDKAKTFVEDFQNEEINFEPKVILFFITRFTSSKLYEPMKLFYQKKGIPTQFYVSFQPKDGGNLSKISNILIQMVNKMGGRGWQIEEKIQEALVVGVESSKVRSDKAFRAASAISCQFGKNLKDIYSDSTSKQIDKLQKNIFGNLDKLILRACDHYEKRMKQLPKDIVVYRMGMGEGQVQNAIKQELIITKQQLFEKYSHKRPKVVFIIVNKKINDRFFDENLQNVDGVVVTDHVVMKDRANFYMIPQKVNKGTATPVHYQIVDNDDSKLDFYDLIQLTYNLTYDYQNWNGPIRVPSVLQNALRLSELNAKIKTDKIEEKLKRTLFML